MTYPKGSLHERMEAYTIPEPNTGCHIFSGTIAARGYGSIYFRNKPVAAHRLAWSMANGKPVPVGMVVRHTCDNRWCVNPSHLKIGTPLDNVQDMHRRGRAPSQRGSRNPAARMTEDRVRAFRYLERNGVPRLVSQVCFSISPQALCNIVKGRDWAHTQEEDAPLRNQVYSAQ